MSFYFKKIISHLFEQLSILFLVMRAAYLVTPRAMMIFEHEALYLRYTKHAFHEYIGILWLKIKGY